jgi:glycosyltransferase involved in cell wall biosynthesis
MTKISSPVSSPTNQGLRLLMITYHFPPIAVSSGYLRPFKMAKYLPQFDVYPTILTVKDSAFEAINKNNLTLLNQLPEGVDYYRCSCVDTSKAFSWRGKYPSILAIPDRWISWFFSAIPKALSLHKQYKFDAIWVTFPISTSLLIALVFSKITGLPLYVDLRDPIWEEETWSNNLKHKVLMWLERKVLKKATQVYFTSPGTMQKYIGRHSEIDPAKYQWIANGYDEEDFSSLDSFKPNMGKTIFLHSGLLPPYERDPSKFFKALSELKAEGHLSASQHLFRFRGSGQDELYAQMATDLNIADLIEFSITLPYHDALQEMLSVDCLMLFQQTTCDWQTPAKLYEYARAQRPILAFAGANSDTETVLKKLNQDLCVYDINDSNQIKQAILSFLAMDKGADFSGKYNYEEFSRKSLAEKLAQTILSSV